MNCKKCNAELRENAKFCDECGEKVSTYEATPEIPDSSDVVIPEPVTPVTSNAEVITPSAPPAPPIIQPQVPITEKSQKKKKAGVIIGCIAAGLLFIAIVFFVIIPLLSSLFGSSTPTGSNSGAPAANNPGATNAPQQQTSVNVHYLGNRRVQYNESDKQYVVFFSLLTPQKSLSAVVVQQILLLQTKQVTNYTINQLNSLKRTSQLGQISFGTVAG